MDMHFCRRCGTPLKHSGKHVYKCENEHTIFANATPAVGVFFLTPDNRIILSVRGIEPHKGKLDAFGGFVDGKESLEAAAVRELQEELGLQPDTYEPLRYLTSGNGEYPYKGETMPTLSAFFYTRLKPGSQLKPADDVADTRTLPLHEVNVAELHDCDIESGIRELQRLFPAQAAD